MLEVCPYCNGEGGWPIFIPELCEPGEDPGWERCEHCDGTGKLEEEQHAV